MLRISLPLAFLAALLVCVMDIAPAQAQASRTWVSGIGDDANPCSRTAPCKTFTGAISKTAASGAINCLDPGGFGSVTITKSITIDCHQTMGSIVAIGTNGITIQASGATVALRGLDFEGMGGGLIGISILDATTVSIDDIVINQFTQQGINDSRTTGGTALFVRNSTIWNNAGAAIAASAKPPTNAANNVVVENVFAVNNGYGVAAADNNNVLVSRSVLSGNATAGIAASANAQVFVDNSEVTGNGTGLQNLGTNAGSLVLGNSGVFFNATGISGASQSFGNNRIMGNTSPGPTPNLGPTSTDHSQE